MRPRNNAAMQRYREEYHRCCGETVLIHCFYLNSSSTLLKVSQ